MDMLESLKFAVLLHGMSADELVKKFYGYNGILATDIALMSRKLLNKIIY